MQNDVNTILQDEQVYEVAQSQEARRSIRAKIISVRLTDNERFPNQTIYENDGRNEEAMTTKFELTDLNQAPKYEN